MAQFVGTWERVKHEDLDKYMQSLGIPEDFQKLAMEQKEVIQMSNEGDVWTNKYMPGDREETGVFKVGVPTEYMTVLGTMCTGTIKSVGDKMVEHHVMADGMVMDVVKEIVDGQLFSTTTTKGVSCKSWYDRK